MLKKKPAEEYFAECRAHLATIETDLLSIEKDGAEIAGPLNRLVQAMHGIKQGASFFKLEKIRELATQTEDALALIRSGNDAAERGQGRRTAASRGQAARSDS